MNTRHEFLRRMFALAAKTGNSVHFDMSDNLSICGWSFDVQEVIAECRKNGIQFDEVGNGMALYGKYKDKAIYITIL